jgi:hypothetical protein
MLWVVVNLIADGSSPDIIFPTVILESYLYISLFLNSRGGRPYETSRQFPNP